MKRISRHSMLRALAGFFAVMLIFTIVSRVTASLTVARVRVEKPSEKKIEHVVNAVGSVDKNLELAVVTEPDLLIKTVYIKEGQKVTEGEVLAEVDPVQLAEQITALEEEIQILKLTNGALAENRRLAEQNRQTAADRAKEDCEQALTEAERQVKQAGEELQTAEDAYESYMAANQGDSLSDEVYARMTALMEAAQAKQNAYETALFAYQTAQRAVQRANEDAAQTPEADYTEEINDIQIAQKERELERLEALEEAQGQILAPVESIVTEVYLRTGQKTTDTAAVTLADVSSGMRFTAHIEKADAKYVSVGDEVTLTKNQKQVSGYTVDSVEINEDGSLELTVLLPASGAADESQGEEKRSSGFSIGDSVDLELRKVSTTSRTAVPLTALHEENGKYYVYVLEAEDTVLGEQYFARRVDVEVKDKNNLYAALEEGTLTPDSQLVTDSDRYIGAGSRVRLWES